KLMSCSRVMVAAPWWSFGFPAMVSSPRIREKKELCKPVKRDKHQRLGGRNLPGGGVMFKLALASAPRQPGRCRLLRSRGRRAGTRAIGGWRCGRVDHGMWGGGKLRRDS